MGSRIIKETDILAKMQKDKISLFHYFVHFDLLPYKNKMPDICCQIIIKWPQINFIFQSMYQNNVFFKSYIEN